MRIVVFYPLGLRTEPSQLSAYIAYKLRADKLIKYQTSQENIIYCPIRRDPTGLRVYSTSDETGRAFEEYSRTLEFRQISQSKDSIMLLFLGHGNFYLNGEENKKITGIDKSGYYHIDDIILISKQVFEYRRDLPPDYKQISLYNCYSGIGYNAETNRVMYISEKMLELAISCTVKGVLDDLITYTNEQPHFTGNAIFSFDKSSWTTIRTLFVRDPYMRIINGRFKGVVNPMSWPRIKYGERVTRTPDGALSMDFDDTMRRSHTSYYPIGDMDHPYFQISRQALYKIQEILRTYESWGDEFSKNEWEGRNPSQPSLEPAFFALDVFLIPFLEYLKLLMDPNVEFAAGIPAGLIKLREYARKSHKSFHVLYNSMIKVFVFYGERYREQILKDSPFGMFFPPMPVQCLQLPIPNRGYRVIWYWTRDVMDNKFKQFIPNTMTLAPYDEHNGDAISSVQVFIKSKQPDHSHFILEIPFSVPNKKSIDDRITIQLNRMGWTGF